MRLPPISAASLKAVSDALPEVDAIHVDLARRHGVHILAASGPMWRTDRFVNAARLITPEGRVGVQDKHIMTPFERDWNITAGAALRVFETALGRIGIAICYDSEFPLLVRAQAEAGAEVILVPSCTERVSGAHRVRTAALARALENTCAVVVSPTVGEATWCRHGGPQLRNCRHLCAGRGRIVGYRRPRRRPAQCTGLGARGHRSAGSEDAEDARRNAQRAGLDACSRVRAPWRSM